MRSMHPLLNLRLVTLRTLISPKYLG
jgi:hypothetical protein